jgi:hypothetical protein
MNLTDMLLAEIIFFASSEQKMTRALNLVAALGQCSSLLLVTCDTRKRTRSRKWPKSDPPLSYKAAGSA